MAAIGEECLDSTKIVGTVGYAGSPLIPRWEVKPNSRPFHIVDPITNQLVADPRVIMIGRHIYQFGGKVFPGHGFDVMRELYTATGKVFHSVMWPLNHAWDGIGPWHA